MKKLVFLLALFAIARNAFSQDDVPAKEVIGIILDDTVKFQVVDLNDSVQIGEFNVKIKIVRVLDDQNKFVVFETKRVMIVGYDLTGSLPKGTKLDIEVLTAEQKGFFKRTFPGVWPSIKRDVGLTYFTTGQEYYNIRPQGEVVDKLSAKKSRR